MYLRADHAEKSMCRLRQLIRENPLGILTTALPSDNYPTLQSTHIPWVLDVEDDSSESEAGVLRGHLARSNPQSKAIIESLQQISASTGNVLEQEVMVLFNSPVQHYVTPKFYTETKPDTGKVVPTWNYAAAAAYGKARIFYEADSDEAKAFLARQIDDLSQYAEEHIMGYTGAEDKLKAWKVSDAPEKYIAILQRVIIGIEIKIDRLEGKFKMSQELRPGDRQGVIQGFESLGGAIGEQMSDLVKERGNHGDALKHMTKT